MNKMGFRPIETHALNCVACDKKLAEVVLVSKEFKYKTEYVAECPCGDTSIPLEIEGKTWYNPVDPLQIVDAKAKKEDSNVYIRLILK